MIRFIINDFSLNVKQGFADVNITNGAINKTNFELSHYEPTLKTDK